MAERERSGPLQHIRVLDLGRIMAAPWATQILADMGADVIKIERPGVGDDTRAWGPPFLKDKDGQPTGESGYYLACNRGKRSVTLDLSKPEGQAIARSLAATADVVIENYKVGTLKRYGLDAELLRAVNPALIYCSVTGFGQDGPRAEEAAYDFAIQAMSGLMSITGERDDAPGGGPQKVGLPIIDLMTGMYATVAILAALAKRSQTGEGDVIDLAMLDVASGILANQAMNWLLTGVAPKRNGNRHPNIQPQDVLPCADGYFVLAVGNDGQFAKMSEAIGHAEWAVDPRYATNPARVAHGAEVTAMLTEAFSEMTKAEITGRLGKAGVPCAPINEIPQVFDEPQIKHRGMLRSAPHPLAGTAPQVVNPIRYASGPLRFDHAPPLLGQHTDEVLDELGVGIKERTDLKAKGVI